MKINMKQKKKICISRLYKTDQVSKKTHIVNHVFGNFLSDICYFTMI